MIVNNAAKLPVFASLNHLASMIGEAENEANIENLTNNLPVNFGNTAPDKSQFSNQKLIWKRLEQNLLPIVKDEPSAFACMGTESVLSIINNARRRLEEHSQHVMSKYRIQLCNDEREPANSSIAEKEKANESACEDGDKSQRSIDGTNFLECIDCTSHYKCSALDDEVFRMSEMKKFLQQGDKHEKTSRSTTEARSIDYDSSNTDDESGVEDYILEGSECTLDEQDQEMIVLLDTLEKQAASSTVTTDSEMKNLRFAHIEHDNEDLQQQPPRSATFSNNCPSPSTGLVEDIDNYVEGSELQGQSTEKQCPTQSIDNSKVDHMHNPFLHKLHLLEHIEEKFSSKKHWTLQGEVIGQERSKNSLLELDLDLPRYKRNMQQTLTDNLAVTADQASHPENFSDFLESIVKHRIRHMIFNDVERRFSKETNKGPTIVPPKIDFGKDKRSLAQIYAEAYQDRLLNFSAEGNKEMNYQKNAAINLFLKVMFKLEGLANYKSRSLLLSSVHSAPEVTSNVVIEDTVPIVMSNNNGLAPHSLQRFAHEKTRKSMTREERQTLHRARKKRTRQMLKKSL